MSMRQLRYAQNFKLPLRRIKRREAWASIFNLQWLGFGCVRPSARISLSNAWTALQLSLTRLQLAQVRSSLLLAKTIEHFAFAQVLSSQPVAFPATLDLVDVVRSLRLPENSNDPGQPQGFWPVNIWAKLRETRFCPANTQL